MTLRRTKFGQPPVNPEAEMGKEKDARIALIKEEVERGAMQEEEAEIRIALIKEELLDDTWQR